MLLGGRVLDADEALEWGLVSEVVADDAVQARAREVAVDLAAGPPLSLGRTRSLLHGAFEVSLAEHMRREGEHMKATGATADAVEGVTAFSERRRPVFRAE
jgi:2-(1,2-epoxy-1,2-dihydrophenyl)acetyl-CoA isomerase